MKKIFMLTLALMLVLGLCACNQTPQAPVVTEYTFPAGTSVLGIDLSGQTPEAGWKTLQEGVNNHTMNISVDGVEVPVTAQQIGLVCSQERYEAIATALEAGAPVEYTGLISFNEGKLRALVNEHFNKPVTEAAIVYDAEAGEFVLIPDAIGQISNPNELVSLLKEQILNLEAAPALTDVSQIVEPTIFDEDDDVLAALETVNKMRTVELSYSFTADGKTTTTDIPAETILSLISLGDDNVTPGIDQFALETYVAELSDSYSAGSTQAPFKATGGGTVGLTVSYNGEYLDQEAMAKDISTCILEGISGKRTAPFQATGIRDMPYGGTYIEVNLSAQKLWFYKNGQCILSTNFVSGKVSAGWLTPNGVFSMYSKSTDTYLVGADYRTFVNYWMPFYGGYGLHDATWRGSFGGEIYLYEGSHGCVNLPLSAAATIYNNASVGTKVIVYGGRTSVPPQPQSLSGTTSYSVAEDAGSITLDIRPRYSGPSMTYTTSDSSIASVSSSGVVTINGVGKAVITVSVPSYNGYTSATISVTINVHSACEEGRHSFGSPTTITAASCQPGLEKVTCSKCNVTQEQELAPVANHKFTTYVQAQAPTCGADGKQISTCDTCKTATDERTVAATGQHTPGAAVTTKEPNCTEKGTTETRCSVCSTVLSTGELATVPTAHVPGALDEKAASCTENGYRKQNCAKCNTTLIDEVITAPGHSYSWVTTSSAGCTTDGQKQNICSGCGSVNGTETIPAYGHSYSGGICGNCGGTDPNYVPPEPAITDPENP